MVCVKTDVNGKTFNLENGEVVIDKLKSESIFRERITEQIYNITIAMPNVKVGSVLDIEFNFPGLPYEWYFQHRIPVKHSELIIENSPYVSFRKVSFGYLPLSEGSDTRWVARNMPAFKSEPYITSIENYMTKFEIDILNVNFPGYIYEEFTTTWEAVNKQLLEHQYFGEVINGSLYLIGTAKDISETNDTPEEKLYAAYEEIKKVKWDEKERLYASNTILGPAKKEKVGNSADINIMLLQLLRKLDIDAYPVALSTRDNGILSPFYPTLNKMNYVIIHATIGNRKYLLDATEELMPIGLIPKRCLNMQGRIIDKDKSGWIDLTTEVLDKEKTMYDLSLDINNQIAGVIQNIKYDYAAFEFRKLYKSFNSNEEYIEDFSNKRPGLTLINTEIAYLDSIYKPVIEKCDIKIQNMVTEIGDLIFINPLFYEQLKENPFKLEERKYPVDFAYPIEKTVLVKLTIPENYAVHQLPEPVKMKIPGDAGLFLYSVVNQWNIIQLTYKFNISKAIFIMDEYPFLKEFYNQIIKKHAETIILKKN